MPIFAKRFRITKKAHEPINYWVKSLSTRSKISQCQDFNGC